MERGPYGKQPEREDRYGYDAPGVSAVCEAEGEKIAAAEKHRPGLWGGRGHLRGRPADPERLDRRRSDGAAGGHRHLLHPGVSVRPADGALVPITGFANAVVSPAIDFRSEGFVTGMAAKMFLIAGPVIVFGTVASVVYGVVLQLLG